ncbi:glycosyl transferase family 2 [Methanobacterium lacus]|uniref:Glycosyl transferase family 2 n=2 Tax=Methanobacterium lacus (strain AL-21) TaxID=877455 RepID=F0T7U1_METLA|nr:glycosyl transferase family 2 [Methanobacterium lacus]
MYSILLMLFMVLASIKTVRNNKPMTVSVIIPAFNEEKTVAHVVSVVKSLPYIGEVVVVDDGSMDQTSKFAEEAGAKVIYHMKNRGKGAAIKTGFKNSKGDIVVFLDADLKNLTQSQVRNIVDPILNGEADVTKTKFKREAGRVTELTAKPLLKFFFPEIKFDQPLSGQFAAKRSFLNKIKLEDDYGVDVGIVLDADVMGMKVKEVDIGKIDHVLSTLTELNVVATEVVRTIVDRATAYGRITMIDSLGQYIRMEILGLSLASMGIFSIFFIRFVSFYVGLAIAIIGVIIAIYYIIKIVRISFNVFSRTDGNMRNLKTFLKMHSPIIVSAMILLAMCTTLLGSVHFEGGKVSIQPVSRNLIIFNSPTNNQTVDVRGPYTVDKALENENTSIRMPTEALATLELNYGDSIYINNEKYVLNVTRPKEDNTMRIPNAALTSMGLNPGDVISDGDLRNRFNNFYAEKALQTNGNSDNINITEGTILTNNMQSGYNINLYLNNTLVSSSYGIIKNGSYSIYINDVKYKTITLNPDNLNQPYTVVIGDDIFKIEFGTPLMTDMEFANSSSGKFLNFIY